MCTDESEVNVLGLTTNLKLYQHLIKRVRNGEVYGNCKEANNTMRKSTVYEIPTFCGRPARYEHKPETYVTVY